MKKYDLKLCNYESDDKDLNCQYQEYKLKAGFVMLEGYKWTRKTNIVSMKDDMATLKNGQVVQVWLYDYVDDHLHWNCSKRKQ